MRILKRTSLLSLSLAAGLLGITVPFVMSIPGCYREDLTEYRQAKHHDDPNVASTIPTSEETSPTSKTSPLASNSSAVNPGVPAIPVATTEPPIVAEQEMPPVSALVPVNVIDGANVRELMKVSKADLQSTPTTTETANLQIAPANDEKISAEPRKVELLIKDKKFRAEPKSGALRISFDDLDLLKVLNMDPVEVNAVDQMPGWLTGLNGKLVRLRGFMYPTFDTEGIENFVLARDNQICCFGRDPKIYDLVQVNMKPGKSTVYIPATRAFDVVGTFKIEMLAQDGKLYGLYVIENAEVIDR